MIGIEGPSNEMLVQLLACVTLVILWIFVQVVFALYYAHEFYGPDAQSSNAQFVFPDSPLPDYWDFVRFAFGIGMRVRAPRAQVTSKKMRRVVLAHSMISFVFHVSIFVLVVWAEKDAGKTIENRTQPKLVPNQAYCFEVPKY